MLRGAGTVLGRAAGELMRALRPLDSLDMVVVRWEMWCGMRELEEQRR
jgi:hypothetical protein